MPRFFLPAQILKSAIEVLRVGVEAGVLSELVERERAAETGGGIALEIYGDAAEGLGVAHSVAYEGLQALSYLVEQAEALDVEPAQALEQICASALAQGVEGAETLSSLGPILETCASAALGRKRQELSRGLALTAASVRTFCDARPVFDLERSEIVEFLPVVTMRVRCTNGVGEVRDLVFELPTDVLESLTEELKTVGRKLKVLESLGDIEPEETGAAGEGAAE